MIGLHVTTISPSSSNSTRSTPWVLGCCGPMLMWRVLLIRWVSIAIGLASQLVAAAGAEDLPRDGEIHRLAADRVVAPQRMALPPIRHHDSGQVRVPVKVDAEQVVHLALVPVGAREDAADARGAVGGLGLEPEPAVLTHRVKQVLELEAGLDVRLVHGCQVDPASVPELVAAAPGRLDDLGRVDQDVRDAVGRDTVQGVRERRLETLRS